MLVSRWFPVALLAVLCLLPTLAPVAEAQPIQWPVRIDCIGVGQNCSPDYEFIIGAGSNLAIGLESLSAPESFQHCAPMRVELFVNETSQGVKELKPANGQNMSSLSWSVEKPMEGSNAVRFRVTGLEKGCNKGRLFRWAARVKVTAVVDGEWRCSEETIPQGFVLVGSRVDETCQHKRANRVRTPRASDVICASSPRPTGFVFTERVEQPSCPSKQAWKIATPKADEETMICPESPEPPPGYVVVGRSIHNRCSPTVPSLTVRYPNSREVICSGSPIPSGYVVVGEKVGEASEKPCESTLPVKTIEALRAGTEVKVCDSSPVPPFWEVEGALFHKPECLGEGANAKKLRALPIPG